MLLAKPVKSMLSKVLAGSPFSLEKQTPIIPIRHMKFDFEPEKLDHRFYMDAELASAYLHHYQSF